MRTVFLILLSQRRYSLPQTLEFLYSSSKTMCDKSSTNRHNMCQVFYQHTPCVTSPLLADTGCGTSSTNRHNVCAKSSTNRHNVCKVLYQQTWCVTKTSSPQTKLNSHPPQVTQDFSAKLKIQIKTHIKETKLSITVAYIVSLYRNYSLHILNQWITDPAIF